MAGSVKRLGTAELESFLRRVRRQRALGRIGEADAKKLDEGASELLAHVVKMTETNEYGREEGSGDE